MKKYDCVIDLHDPWVDHQDIKKKYHMMPISNIDKNVYDAVILAVAHDKFKVIGIESIRNSCKKNHIVYDLKYIFPTDKVDLSL